MKKILLFTFLLGMFGFAKAQNKLVVFNQDGKQFYIILNGIKQNAEPKTNVKIEQLTSEAYKLKIIFADGATPDIDKSIYFADPNHEYVTEVKKNKKGDYKLRMVSYSPTASSNYQATNTINYTNTDAVVTNTNNNNNLNTNVTTNGNNGTVTTHQTTTTITTNTNTNVNNGNGNGENVNMNVNVGGVGMNVNVNVDENMNNTNTNTTYTETHTTTTNTTTTNTNINNNTNNNGGNQFGCYTSTVDYNSMISAVKNEGFADNKKMVAKQALDNKCISTDQVIGLMKEFSFDDDKLEVAKYCYDRCSDRDNYYKVNSAFSFSDSKEALNKYIGNK